MATCKTGILCGFLLVGLQAGAAAAAPPRSEAHQQHAEKLWAVLHGSRVAYAHWEVAAEPIDFSAGPPNADTVKVYVNRKDALGQNPMPYGTVVVTEQYLPGQATPVAVTVRHRFQEGYCPASDDWYWAHYLPDGKVVATVADRSPLGKRGFVVYPEDARLWVFRTNSPELAEYLQAGELAKHVIRPGAGPGGLTLKGPDAETLTEYLAAAEGFVVKVVDGRLWVFRAGSPELADAERQGEPEKSVTRPGAGPEGLTLRGPDAETLEAYLRATTTGT